MIAPALRDGATDPRLRGLAYQVLGVLWLHGVLDPIRWRSCKAEALAHLLGCDPSSAWRALETLRTAGYVERHVADRWAYRLAWSALAPVQAVDTERDGGATVAA